MIKTVKKISNIKLKNIKRILLVVVGALVVPILFLSFLSKNIVLQSRNSGEYTLVKEVAADQYGDGSDIVYEYSFILNTVKPAEMLAFFTNHHNVQVYIADECVYNLTAAENSVFSTIGSTWVMFPLYENDTGKEVHVVLTPLYKNYHDTPEFFIGSELAVLNAAFHRAMPALILSLCVIFAGILLICLAVYQSVKKIFTGRLYAVGFMAISAGLWRISYDKFSCFLLSDKAVAVYTISIISLMVMALSMLNSIEINEKNAKFIHLCSCGYCIVYIIQLILQITGTADLRQTLKLIHITIVISAAVFLVNGIKQWFGLRAKKSGTGNFGWILGIGVVCDLLMYYFAATSFGIICTLIAILCYTVLEGVWLLLAYIEQKSMLEEMEKQLTLSRTTTMMSQIRSHFVFNILNAISGMCKYDPQMADETVVRFARYLRNNIDIMENDRNVPFVSDLQQLEDYVALEQVRFGDKLEFYADIETVDFMIPPLILQPVVENAIKHGVSKKQGNGTIILRTRSSGNNIVITVEDDGVGFDMAELQKEKSVGIRNIRFRLEHLVNGTLDIQSKPGIGTTVNITIPKEKYNAHNLCR